MGRRQIIVLILISFPVLIAYNNCSRSIGQTEGSSLDSSTFISGVDNGFVGKAQYEYMAPEPGCEAELGTAAQTLTMDWQSKNANMDSSTCDSVWNGPVHFNHISDNGYDSSVLYYENKLFVTPLLHDGIPGHVYYKEFCFNEILQQDFLLQSVEETVPGQAEPLKKWTGITLFGPQAQIPGVLFNGGYLDQFGDGSMTFSTHNETFEVRFDPVDSDGNLKARYIKRDGTTIPMNCWRWVDSAP